MSDDSKRLVADGGTQNQNRNRDRFGDAVVMAGEPHTGAGTLCVDDVFAPGELPNDPRERHCRGDAE